MRLKPLVISAPFGNYLMPEGVTATMGTFTAERRGGVPARVWRVLKTVRYYRRLGAWVNKIGLRNPGIDWLVAKVDAGRLDLSDKIVSVHGFDEAQWMTLLEKASVLGPGAIELNMSCPNVGEIDWPGSLFGAAAGCGSPVIVKLPPIRYRAMGESALEAGLTGFHCCNTLPVPGGGLSGRPLRPLVERCLEWFNGLTERPGLTMIAGGGVYGPEDVDVYADLGAEHVAVGTKLMHPRYLLGFGGIAAIRARAEERLGRAEEG